MALAQTLTACLSGVSGEALAFVEADTLAVFAAQITLSWKNIQHGDILLKETAQVKSVHKTTRLETKANVCSARVPLIL